MFTYNDVKTKNYTEAFQHLTKAFEYKMSILPPWSKGVEALKVEQTRQIFKAGFWPEGIGSPSRVPVFIIGFVRSGSTLLERVLDAHPSIVGTGENSVFNGRLDEIRNRIVQVSSSQQPELLATATQQMADDVVDEMKRRWQVLEASTDKPAGEVKFNPLRFVDKYVCALHTAFLPSRRTPSYPFLSLPFFISRPEC
jgi:Sulfotransferase family